MKHYNDGEWQYIDYVTLEQSIVVKPVKTRYAGGMVWFDKFEMANIMDWEVRSTRLYLDELEANGDIPEEQIAIFEDKTPEGRKFDTKCYSASIMLQISDCTEIRGNQHKLFVLSKSGLDTNHDYEKQVLELINKNSEIESKYRYNILDYLWFHGEKVKESGGRSDGYFVLLFYIILFPIITFIISPHFLPIIIAIVLLLTLVCVFLFASRERRWAVKVHFGLNHKANTNYLKPMISKDGFFMFLHLLSWLAWWSLLAVLLK